MGLCWAERNRIGRRCRPKWRLKIQLGRRKESVEDGTDSEGAARDLLSGAAAAAAGGGKMCPS